MHSAAMLLFAVAVSLLAGGSAMRSHTHGTVQKKEELTGPPLCDAGIVADTCKVLNDGEESEGVSLEALHDTMSATPASARRFWEALQLAGKTSVPCLDLCQETVKLLKDDLGVTVPDSSDVGCFKGDAGPVCDIDLSVQAIKDLMKNQGDLPNFPERPDLEAAAQGQIKERPEKSNTQVETGRTAEDPAEEVEASLVAVATRVAELFRIHPLDDPDMSDGSSEASAMLETSYYGWRQDTARRNQQAQAYVTNALSAFRARRTGRHFERWFGRGKSSDPESRRELLRILNSVDAMLTNVEYVYPGEKCEPNTYAYVYPRHPDRTKVTNYKGELIFYLCDLYMRATPSVQIETLTHEGSHHASAFTTDVCADEVYGYASAPRIWEERRREWPRDIQIGQYYSVRGQGDVQIVKITPDYVTIQEDDDRECRVKAYGRDTCASLARYNPFQAMRNADNFCYYIQDVTDA